MGPDIGVGALGAALGVVASLLLVLISLAWYPLKRLKRRLRSRAASPGRPTPAALQRHVQERTEIVW